MRAGGRRPVADSCKLLYWKWDPISVNDASPWTHDEYDTYAGLDRDEIEDGSDAAEIARFLQELDEQRMGLSSAAASARRRNRSWSAVATQSGSGETDR
jgi:hypothetical protein